MVTGEPPNLFSLRAAKNLSGTREEPPGTYLADCMDTSLTVADRRHLALPDFCLFAPTELQISASLSQNEFSRLGKVLSAVDQASDLWACDYALAGQKRWGDEGLKLAATATRLSIGYLKVSARIAERFDPARRFPNMTREHYRGLCCFPVEFTDKWLPTVVEKGFGARTLRAVAVEAFGSDPKAGYSKNKKRQVSLPEILYARLKECSPILKTAVFIELVLADFASNSTPEQQARIADALGARDVDKVRQRRNLRKPKAVPEPEIVEPADVRFQLKKSQEEAKPTYAERREEQIAGGAQPVPLKDGKYKSKVRIVFVECKGNASIENNEGGVARFGTGKMASRFYTQENAEVAAAEYSADRGYPCEAFICKACSSVLLSTGGNGGTQYPRTVWHVRGVTAA